MYRKMLHIVLLLSITGCGGIVQNSWTNFRAYHNAFYNVKEYYRSGSSQVEQQSGKIDPQSPIRIYPLPSVTGETDFENVIEKGNRLLLDFPESVWVDETMEVIGKSHYYLHEFYPALRQFEELYEYTDNAEIRYEAVLWKARALFDLGAHEEGAVFLENELEESGRWETGTRSEIELILAEHHIQLGNREEAGSILREALNGLDKGEIKARAFFLLGQLFEIMGRYGEAEFAYSSTLENFPEFELLYIANMRKAEVLRKRENREDALEIYRMMIRNDKYTDRLPHIRYEIARTEEESGNHFQAEQIYQSLLKGSSERTEAALLADTYFRLGKIHADVYGQFRPAAAYFDSSASRSGTVSSGLFADIDEKNEQAGAWREYSLLRRQLAVVDSLLWLASLAEEESDAPVSGLNEYERQATEDTDTTQPALDTENLPAVEEERQKLKETRASIRYELGSLLMLTLDRPADAVPFFKSLVDEHPDHETVPAALYALFDIYYAMGEREEADVWSSRLRRSYPETVYAKNLEERLGNNVESLLYRPD